jgi:predicted protein tyrosine phosphatase
MNGTSPSLDLLVCGLEEIDGSLDGSVTHVISILDPDRGEPDCVERFCGGGLDQRLLRLRFHDVIEHLPTLAAPDPGHIAAIVRFAGAMRAHSAPRLLVHCHMGISRSTAAAIIVLADRHGDPEGAVEHVTAIRPAAWPNLRMIELADRMLRLDARLVGAVRRHHAKVLLRRPELREAFRASGRAREVEGLETLA